MGQINTDSNYQMLQEDLRRDAYARLLTTLASQSGDNAVHYIQAFDRICLIGSGEDRKKALKSIANDMKSNKPDSNTGQ